MVEWGTWSLSQLSSDILKQIYKNKMSFEHYILKYLASKANV